MITAKIVADSISPAGKRITTMQLTYPRFIHAEFMTHRVFSRNASSSRAIPVAKMLAAIRAEPASPIHWGANQPGMQASGEVADVPSAQHLWLEAAKQAATMAERMMNIGLHKQVANRILEPFQHIHVVMTSTEWENFYALRNHVAADPNICELAKVMMAAHEASTPQRLEIGEWHLPYVTNADHVAIRDYVRKGRLDYTYEDFYGICRKVSAARCCRVSYLKHDGDRASIEEEIALCDKLAGSVPIHASPFEHQASPDQMQQSSMHGKSWLQPELHGNFVGWIQSRKLIERQFVKS